MSNLIFLVPEQFHFLLDVFPDLQGQKGDMDNQPLATLVDIDLPSKDLLLASLLERVNAFFEAWIKEDAFSPSTSILAFWQIDNFGMHGTIHLLSKFGIGPPDKSFVGRAEVAWIKYSR